MKLDTPVSGWRAGDGSAANYRQVVNYPASSVNVAADQATTARIRGAIESQPKDRPATLVVNGEHATEGGRRWQLRPPVRLPVRQQQRRGAQRRRAVATGPVLSRWRRREVPAKLRVLLSWDSDNTDLDLHLADPGRRPCLVWQSFAGQRRDPGCRRHHRLRPGNHRHAAEGPYLVYVNYFGGGYGSSEDGAEQAAQDLTTARITLVTEEGTPNEKQETFLVPMRKPGELTLVKRFSYP